MQNRTCENTKEGKPERHSELRLMLKADATSSEQRAVKETEDRMKREVRDGGRTKEIALQ